MIHRTPVIVGVRPVSRSSDAPSQENPIHGFYITRTANRALWGVASSDFSSGAPEFFVGCLPRKIQFDLLLTLVSPDCGKSSLDFIYNQTVLGSTSWEASQPV